ncbi:HNH endonuclease [Microbacterium sediminis]|uniref:Uncharacterized protein n=1 Tax=Microbacterium sediminis TaxID=904291 RepID=A0A1B9NDP0_9MICO|nr:HNH endonuclease signature motif containing protein [Microbacterium sediminis]OCG74700.1 hypothetical protein A7J15_03980 [Microbacterium sediminis]QBR74996.1 HNH endonuclease [Microbacterium sediminis]
MTTTAQLLDQAERLVRDARASLDAPGLAPAELTGLLQVLGRVRREVDAATAVVASEVSRQSRRELGRDALARRQGFRSPVAMIATVTGSSAGDAVRLVQVGDAIAPRASLAGEAMPARHPHVAEAVSAGRLGTSAAAAIVSLLDRMTPRAGQERCLQMERVLAERLSGATPDEARRLLIEAEAALDPGGAETRHDVARAARELRTSQDAEGMTVLRARLDAETAAPILAVLDAEVTRVIRSNEREEDEARKDPRTVPQIQADALAALAAHALGCDRVPTGATTTVVVRMDLPSLLAATGRAGGEVVGRSARGEALIRIDGVDQPVPASAIRRMASDAEVIPMLLARDGQVLDLGRRERLFTKSQKLALAERDGGCAFCGAPPGHTVVHHIRWWSRGGPTNLDNGVLLCTACHHRIHDDGWEIEVHGQHVRFIPPPWLDPARVPRAAARERVRVAA